MDREQLEKLGREYQELQMQLQSLALQKMQFGEQKEEYTQARKHLESASGRIYAEVGGLIVETTKDGAMKELSDKLESVEMRLGIVGKQYDEAVKKEQSMRTALNAEIDGQDK